jgi:hypothetical protein
LGGQKNGTGAGTEDGVAFDGKFADSTAQPLFLEELQLGSRFAARKDQAVAVPEIGDRTDFDRLGAEVTEASAVGGEVTLDSQDADLHDVFRFALDGNICA